jgi:hypothetical protein
MSFILLSKKNQLVILVVGRLIKRLRGQFTFKIVKKIKMQKVTTKLLFMSEEILQELIPTYCLKILETLYEKMKKGLNMLKYFKGDICQEARNQELKLKMYQNKRNSLVKFFLPHEHANAAIFIKQLTWFIFTRICYCVKYGYLSFFILLHKMLFNLYNSWCVYQLTSQSIYNRKLKLWEYLYLFLRRRFLFINLLEVIKRLTLIFNFLFMVKLIQPSTSVLEILLEVKEIPEISIVNYLGSLIVIAWIIIKFIHFFRKFKSVKIVTLLIFVLFFLF